MAKGKKPDFALVVGESAPEDEMETDEGSSEETPVGVQAAMEELIAAVKDGDAESAASAFRAAFMACESESEEDSEDEEV